MKTVNSTMETMEATRIEREIMRHARIARAWINQPSSLQEYHARHGERVLVDNTYSGNTELHVMVYTTTPGPLVSGFVARLALSFGWPSD